MLTDMHFITKQRWSVWSSVQAGFCRQIRNNTAAICVGAALMFADMLFITTDDGTSGASFKLASPASPHTNTAAFFCAAPMFTDIHFITKVGKMIERLDQEYMSWMLPT